jgi:hypothetical protein
MRTVKWNAFLSGLCGFALALGTVAGSAQAQVTTEEGASILIFPKVRADGTFDTIIQITNTSNMPRYAHCYYVEAETCQEIDFDIFLTAQQPTHWYASTGRRVNPGDRFGNDGSGFDPGLIPPLGDSFEGELKCVLVADTGEPISANSLKGEATLKAVNSEEGVARSGDVSKYNAIGIKGNPDVQPSNPLVLDGNVYGACPEKLIVSHFATGAESLVASRIDGVESFVSSELTLVPCSEDFERQIPTTVVVQFLVFNALEQRFSASTAVTCSLTAELTEIDQGGERSIFSENVLGTAVGHAEITPVVLPDGSSGGVVGVLERFTRVWVENDAQGAAANGSMSGAHSAHDLHTQGSFVPPAGPDQIQLIEAFD